MKPYKGYTAVVEYDEEDAVFHGRIAGIRDIVTFEADTAAGFSVAFHDSVDVYLDMCAADGVSAQKPYSGKLALRTTPEVHAMLDRAAVSDGKSINQWVSDTLASAARKRLESGNTKVRMRQH